MSPDEFRNVARIYRGAYRSLVILAAYRAPAHRGERATIARRVRRGEA